MTKKSLTLKHQIWCNFNTKFGVIVGDALTTTQNINKASQNICKFFSICYSF